MDPDRTSKRQMNSKLDYEPFPSDQTEIQLTNDDGLIVETLKLDNNDPIFADSFRSMIKDHFAEGKHFFVAKIVATNVNWTAATVTSSTTQVAPITSDR